MKSRSSAMSLAVALPFLTGESWVTTRTSIWKSSLTNVNSVPRHFDLELISDFIKFAILTLTGKLLIYLAKHFINCQTVLGIVVKYAKQVLWPNKRYRNTIGGTQTIQRYDRTNVHTATAHSSKRIMFAITFGEYTRNEMKPSIARWAMLRP